MGYTWIYIVAGVIICFLFLMFFGYQWLAYKLLGNNPKPIDEEQKTKNMGKKNEK
jgi:uncharacterized protein YneF (UPF0154 family)